jgi:hypothetical protein
VANVLKPLTNVLNGSLAAAPFFEQIQEKYPPVPVTPAELGDEKQKAGAAITCCPGHMLVF